MEFIKNSSMEPSVLSDWKSIARYLGKGVRTVQRWEATLGLPVRRMHLEGPKAGVMAVRAEIDAWMKARPLASDRVIIASAERDELLRTIAELRSENQHLRQQLEQRKTR